MMTAGKGTILLVDDDPAILLTVGDSLQSAGYNVMKAASADEALASVEAKTPDLIILDIRMPGRSGLSFLADIADEHGKVKYAVLVFTVWDTLGEFVGDAGVAGFLPKTADPVTLLKEVDRIVTQVQHKNMPQVLHTGLARVLIVEDETTFGDRLRGQFQKAGYEVVLVNRCDEVVETVLRERPDLVLIKFVLPGTSGAHLAALLGSLLSTRNLPVVLYDDSGMEWPGGHLPNVKSFVANAHGDNLIRAVTEVLKRPRGHS